MKQLTEMKLTRMAAALSSQMDQPGTYEELTFREKLALLVTREPLERDQRNRPITAGKIAYRNLW